jgi:hypothetical protein
MTLLETPQNVVERYVAQFEANLTDYNVQRKLSGGKWIYDDLPRADMSGYPRIGVSAPTTDNLPFDVGYTHEELFVFTVVVVRVKRGSKYIVGTTEKRDLQMLDYLAKAVSDLVKTSGFRSDLLTNCNVLSTVPITENLLEDDASIGKQLTFKNQLIR